MSKNETNSEGDVGVRFTAAPEFSCDGVLRVRLHLRPWLGRPHGDGRRLGYIRCIVGGEKDAMCLTPLPRHGRF